MQPLALRSPSSVASRVVLLGRKAEGPAALGMRMAYERDEEVFGEGESARHVYRVLSGAARTYRVLADGRRQVVEFHLPGDVFGLEGELRHPLGAEAIGDTTLQVMRRSAFLDDVAQGAASALAVLLQTVQRAHAHMLLLGRQTACERVSAFLLDFQRRTGGEAVIDLPMSRQDIADYLGLTIETVSRTLTQLQGAGLIDLVSCRRIALRDQATLDRISQ